jgi:hypothetical protein
MSYAALILSHSITPRLQYLTDFLSHYYGLPFKLTSDEEKYIALKGECRINYTYHRLTDDEIFIHPHALLSETYIRQVKIECFEKNGYTVFFKTEGDLGFDLFAAVFYLLTRYEEYLPHRKDSYGRYTHQDSTAFREGFLHLPLINSWLEDFRMALSEKNTAFSKPGSGFRFLPTYDIDMAWSFRNKGFKRNAGGLLLLALKMRFKKLSQRIRVLQKKEADPFDCYGWMDELHQQYSLSPVYFLLVAKEKGRYDKNTDISDPEFRELLHSISPKYEVGLHPSWISGDVPSLLVKEKKALEKIIDHPVHASRQHFIRFDLPVTYQRLIAAGITEDYSMGYGTINGFRASVATPFYWYDLKNEQATELLIHPFCFMDANAFYEQKFSPEAALEELLELYKNTHSVNGTMITIWHNSFLGSDEVFAGWKEVYAEFVAVVSSP